MTQVLRQSTAVDVLIGPFLDVTDGKTAETGESPSVKLSKNGQTLTAKSDVTTPVHDADGYYNCEFDATDTGTVGTLVLTVAGTASALPVRHEYQVIEEAVYDAIYASSATLAVGSVTGAVGSVTGNIGGLDSTAQGNVRDAVGLASANLDTQLLSLDNAVDGIVNLESGIILGSVQAGTITATAVTTDLSGYADDALIGRVIVWLSGDCVGEARAITDYADANGLVTFAALTTAPADSDEFKIV